MTAAVSQLGDPLNTTTSSGECTTVFVDHLKHSHMLTDDLLFNMDAGTESTSTPSEENVSPFTHSTPHSLTPSLPHSLTVCSH